MHLLALTPPWRRVALACGVAALAALAGAPEPAHASGDHDRARAAVQGGQVLPLKTLLERLERTHPGQVLEVEMDRDDGRWVYEVRLLLADGRLLKLDVDAASGEVLRRRDRGPARDPGS